MYINCAHFVFAGYPLNCFSRLYPSSKVTSKIDVYFGITWAVFQNSLPVLKIWFTLRA